MRQNPLDVWVELQPLYRRRGSLKWRYTVEDDSDHYSSLRSVTRKLRCEPAQASVDFSLSIYSMRIYIRMSSVAKIGSVRCQSDYRVGSLRAIKSYALLSLRSSSEQDCLHTASPSTNSQSKSPPSHPQSQTALSPPLSPRLPPPSIPSYTPQTPSSASTISTPFHP
jgi:hypothetical protein